MAFVSLQLIIQNDVNKDDEDVHFVVSFFMQVRILLVSHDVLNFTPH